MESCRKSLCKDIHFFSLYVIYALGERQAKAEKLNLQDVKNVLDDHIKIVLESGFGWQEDHTHSNVRLVLGYLSSLIAGVTAIHNYRVPFNDCKDVLAVAVLSLMSLYTSFVEKDAMFVAWSKDKTKKLLLTTRLKNYDPNYHLSLEIFDKKGDKVGKTREYSNIVSRWFDIKGNFVGGNFFDDIKVFGEKEKLIQS